MNIIEACNLIRGRGWTVRRVAKSSSVYLYAIKKFNGELRTVYVGATHRLDTITAEQVIGKIEKVTNQAPKPKKKHTDTQNRCA
jgi:hypothetical protein